ncbi:MAG TPA: ABC transporter permease subunit [Mycobacteriales bacterium]|nr:ABC transporter permease subunit [Mycobacteriales bacterium]
MTALVAVARPTAVLVSWAVRESLRRRVFVIVTLLTIAFLVLYAVGCRAAFRQVTQFSGPDGVDGHEFAGATLNGLAMFAVLFLGCVLAAFLTLSTVRGDAENGLLQPLVVRPVGRAQVIIARWLAATVVCAGYVAVVYTAVLLILHGTGSWSPDRLVGPGVLLAAAVSVLAALCVLGSVVFTATANGIATFMVLGSGLFAGLLGQVGHGIGNRSLEHAAHVVSWVLPFEALYQAALSLTTVDQVGLTRFLVRLGPLGGGEPAGAWLGPYVVGYLALVGAVAIFATSRRDL